jgi:hypothetical protein
LHCVKISINFIENPPVKAGAAIPGGRLAALAALPLLREESEELGQTQGTSRGATTPACLYQL